MRFSWKTATLLVAPMLFLSVSKAQLLDANKLGWQERLGVILIAEQLDIDPDLVLGTRSKYDDSIFDLAPIYSFERHAKGRFGDIYRMREEGMGWGQIAHELNIHPGTFNKMRRNGEFDRNHIWDDVIRNRYRMTEREINVLRKKGYDWDEIASMAHIQHRCNANFDDIEREWKRRKNWDEVRKHFGVKDDWGKGHWDGVPQNSNPPTEESSGSGKGKGKGNSKGKGRG